MARPDPAGDFEPITTSAPLERELRARIEREGAITFRDFMDAALYHRRYGYYRTRAAATSRGGDYVTSPEVHPVFGALVGRQLARLWEALGSPRRFDVVEPGPGRGLLARDVIAWAQRQAPEFAAALRYTLVERSGVLRAEQQRTLEPLALPKQSAGWTGELPHDIEGCVLSNELIDAFPVHRVLRADGDLREVYVALDGDRFVEHVGPLSDPAIRSYFDDLGVLPGEACYAEVNLAAPRWIAHVGQALRRGWVLTFDYGSEASDLYAPWRRDGTLLAFYRHAVVGDPYAHVGQQDLTASVDFTTLRRAAEAHGLRTLGYTDQASFLVRMGIGEGVAAAHGQLEEYFARRQVVLDLVDPAKLGRVRVLLQGKEVPEASLRGFDDA